MHHDHHEHDLGLAHDLEAINALARRYEDDRRDTVARMAGALVMLTDKDQSMWDDLLS